MSGSPSPYRSTIDTAAVSKDLTTVETVAARLGVTFTTAEETLVGSFIAEQSARLANYCQRDLAEDKRTDYFRTVGCRWIETLWASHWPITTIHAIVENGVTLTTDQYEFNGKTREIWRLDGSGNRICWANCERITIQHTSGFQLLPTLTNDAEWACIQLVLREWHGRGRDPAAMSFEVPDVYQESVTVPGGRSFTGGLPTEVAEVMDAYSLGPVIA